MAGFGACTMPFVLLICAATAYPECHATDNVNDWTDITDYDDGTDGYPVDSAIAQCKATCRVEHSTTFTAVRKNTANATDAKCKCGDVKEGDSQNGCDWTCENQECGDDSQHSVYPVCPHGMNGERCTLPCPPSCKNDVCHILDGTCPDGCEPYSYGPVCEDCPPNCDGECDDQSGDCISCKPSWYTLQCDRPCSANCDSKCNIHSGTCLGCDLGWFGAKCNDLCSQNCLFQNCTQDTGNCLNGCEDGWFGLKCNANCSANCKNDTCYQNNGTCTHHCEPGYFSLACDNQCPAGCTNTGCALQTGVCTEGCIPGFYGFMCDKVCPDNCLDLACNRKTGLCTVGCISGWTGSLCKVRDKPGLSKGAMVGIIVAVVAVTSMIIVILVFLIRLRKELKDGRGKEGERTQEQEMISDAPYYNIVTSHKSHPASCENIMSTSAYTDLNLPSDLQVPEVPIDDNTVIYANYRVNDHVDYEDVTVRDTQRKV